MLVFKYTKTDGAEYISHLDTLKHLCKIMRRADIDITKSKGFNPHMHIYMNAPMGVGIKSLCEYCYVDTEQPADEFMNKFNDFTVRGITCLSATDVSKKVNVAGAITRARYQIYGVNKFEPSEILNSQEFLVTAKSGEQKNLRARIYGLERAADGCVIATLGFGNDTLRADTFAKKLIELYGGELSAIIKTDVFALETPFDEYVGGFKI